MTELSAEDAKLVTLARATRARTGASEGAAVRDLDGRTYAAATVSLPSLKVSALGVCVAMAVSSGSRGLEAAVVMGGPASARRRRRRRPARVRGRRRGGAPCLSGRDPRSTGKLDVWATLQRSQGGRNDAEVQAQLKMSGRHDRLGVDGSFPSWRSNELVAEVGSKEPRAAVVSSSGEDAVHLLAVRPRVRRQRRVVGYELDEPVDDPLSGTRRRPGHRAP